MATTTTVLRHTRGLPVSKQYGERLRLLVLEGQDKGTCFSALGDVLFLGREGCQIVLHDPNVSHRHAELAWHGDHYVLRDLGSANGVLCNGRKVPQTRLHPGDLLLFGLTVVEVCLPGQTRRREKPVLPSAAARRAGPPPGPATQPVPLVTRRRMMVTVALFFLLSGAYVADLRETVREHSRAGAAELEDDPETLRARRIARGDSEEQLKEMNEKIGRMKAILRKAETYRISLEEKNRVAEIAQGPALRAVDALNAELARKPDVDADTFFRSGVRELQNRNYSRAFTALNTALTIDPGHELAKLYLATARRSMLTEMRSLHAAGIRAMAAHRYREARMNFRNVILYLGNDDKTPDIFGPHTTKNVQEILEEARKELAEIDAIDPKAQR